MNKQLQTRQTAQPTLVRLCYTTAQLTRHYVDMLKTPIENSELTEDYIQNMD